MDCTAGAASDKGSRRDQQDRFCVYQNFNNLLKKQREELIRRGENEDDLITIDKKRRCMFGVFDGHGGVGCVRYIYKKLPLVIARTILKNKDGSRSPEDILIASFNETGDRWIRHAIEKKDTSGSTATVCLIIEGIAHICYIGDSPAWVLKDPQLVKKSERINKLTTDHNPNNAVEMNRIKNAGGSIKETTHIVYEAHGCFGKRKVIPVARLDPGGIAVSRSFGDIACILPDFGGVPGTLIHTPEYTQLNFADMDEKKEINCNKYILLATDGFGDNMCKKLNTLERTLTYHMKQAVSIVETGMRRPRNGESVEEFCSSLVAKKINDMAISENNVSGSGDNSTVIVIVNKSAIKFFGKVAPEKYY